jgi:hypothetical protein
MIRLGVSERSTHVLPRSLDVGHVNIDGDLLRCVHDNLEDELLEVREIVNVNGISFSARY